MPNIVKIRLLKKKMEEHYSIWNTYVQRTISHCEKAERNFQKGWAFNHHYKYAKINYEKVLALLGDMGPKLEL